MATQRTRGSYYDVDRTYSQADFNELLRQLAAREDLARRDLSALTPTAGTTPGGEAVGQEGVFTDSAGTQYRAVYVDAQGRPVDQYIDGPEGRMANPNARLGYYETILDQGGPGQGYNTFSLDPASMGVRDDQDWMLAAQYNPDGTLREITPRERMQTSTWQALRPALAMAGLVAGGGWLANALQGAGAAGGAGTAGAQSAAVYGNLANPATSAMVNLPGIGPEAAAILAAGGSGTAAGQAILQNGLQGAAAAGATGAAGAGGAAGAAGAVGSAAAGAAGNLGSTVGEWLSNPAVIGGGLNLVGGYLGSEAAQDAAAIQAQSAQAAIDEVRRQYDQNREDQMPWLQAGQTSLADLMGQMPDLQRAYTQADFQNDPGYQFEMAEGQRALDAAARARGMYGSSGSLRELLRYSQGLASTRYQDAWNRDLTNRQNTYNMLAGVSGTGQVTAGNLGSMGQNTANTVGDLLTQTGNSQAAGRIGSTNAWTQAGSNALNAWQQQMLIDRLGTNVNRW